MNFWYLPTLSFSLWPCVVLVLVFIPISLYHERTWRRTLAEYATARREAGATEREWPPADARHLLGIQPRVLYAVAAMLGAMTALGIVVLAAWPHRLPHFDAALNYFDRPYLLGMSVIGLAAVVAIVALAFDISHQPWAPVAERLRRSMYAPAEKRARLFSAALAADPGVPHPARATCADDDVAYARAATPSE